MMNYQFNTDKSLNDHLVVTNFDNMRRIDLKRSTMDRLNKISLKASNAYLVFERTNGLFTLICYNPLALDLDHDTILEEAYLWLREMELKFYGEKIFNYQIED